MSKKGDITNYFIIIFGVILMLVALVIAGTMIYESFRYDKMCLRNVAKEYCDEVNLVFERVENGVPPHFICREDTRIMNNIEVEFTKGELEGCKK